MNLILFDGPERNKLLPLTYTRPVAELRVGILTIAEKWQKLWGGTPSYLTEEYLSIKYPAVEEELNYLVNGSVLPTPTLVEAIKNLKPTEAIFIKDEIIACCMEADAMEEIEPAQLREVRIKEFIKMIRYPWEIFSLNDEQLRSDFDLLTEGRESAPLSDTNRVLGQDIFVEEGATVECATLNAQSGPIYIGADAEIMEGSMVRGPFALCDHSTLKMGAKIYGATTIGPHCKVGGEVNNSVFLGYANKAHDGFLGNSVIGEWCNIGADSNNSNLKNNYADVRIWSYETERFVPTGLQFCGLIMGDHSKCGINTMFNTGTVVGVSANIFGSGFPRNFVPSFSWGGAAGMSTYKTEKAFEVAERVMDRRGKVLDTVEKDILRHIFEESKVYRRK